MTLARDKTQALLEAIGFQVPSAGMMRIGDTFHLSLEGKWFIQDTGLYAIPPAASLMRRIHVAAIG